MEINNFLKIIETNYKFDTSLQKQQERKTFIRSEAVTMSVMIQVTQKNSNKTYPDQLHLIQDFQNCFQNFSSCNFKEVEDLMPLTAVGTKKQP